jgi:hypothetical protein
MGIVNVGQNDTPIEKETTDVKHSKAGVRGKARAALEVRFEPQNLTPYSGLILFQHFFSLIGIKERLWGCFRHLKVNPSYSHHVIMMLLVVHLIIGHRKLRDVAYYRDDGMVKRVLGLKRLADVSTISRSLGSADEVSVEKIRVESRNLVLERVPAINCIGLLASSRTISPEKYRFSWCLVRVEPRPNGRRFGVSARSEHFAAPSFNALDALFVLLAN